MHTKPLLPLEVRRELRAIVKRDGYEYFTLLDHLSEALEAVDGSGRSPHLLGLLEEIFAVFDDPRLAKRKAARVATAKKLARLRADAEAAEWALAAPGPEERRDRPQGRQRAGRPAAVLRGAEDRP